MPAPTTSDEFLELVRKSGVVDTTRLQTYVDRLRETGQFPTAPDDLARQLIQDGVITHFQAEQFRAGRWRRFTIGKYKVLERLGAGGMGTVYLCEHMLMKRRVAVKVLPPSKVNDSSSLERFYREAKAVAALDHPNIVRAYDIDEDDKLHFLVLEHVDGSSLQEIIKKTGPMHYTRAAHYMRQSALGLQHAHEAAALVHRDIKPGNILVDRNGVVKLLDMGLARFFHDDTDDLTKKFDENVLGTADYLAPEQALDSHGADIRADIYSLGGTFYFCLTGRTPFTEGTVAQKLIWHQTRQPKAIRSFVPEVPEALVAVIDKMMAKDKNERYQTPLEVAEALEEWTQTPIPPPPDEEMPQFSLAARSSGAMSDTDMSSSARSQGETVPARKPRHIGQSSSSHRSAAPPASPPPRPQRPVPRSSPEINGLPPAPPPPPPPAAEPEPEGPVSDLRITPTSLQDLRRRGLLYRWETLSKRTRWTILAAAGMFPLVFVMVWLFTGEGKSGDGAKGAGPLVVDGTPGRSLAAALRKAKDGDRILIKADIKESSLSLNVKSNIVIEGEQGKKLVWRCPDDAPADTKHMLLATAVPGLKIRNLTIDGGGKAEDLVSIYNKCPGLTLEKITFQNMRKYGVLVTNCEGSADAPVTLAELTFDIPRADQTGVFFDLKDHSAKSVKINAHIRLYELRFQGAGRKIAAPLREVIDPETVRLPQDITLAIVP